MQVWVGGGECSLLLSESEEMETGEMSASGEREGVEKTSSVFWRQFLRLVHLLKSLNLLNFFADFAVADIMQIKVRPNQVCSLSISDGCLSVGERAHPQDLLWGI